MTAVVSLREVVEPTTGSVNPKLTPNAAFTYVDVAAVDNTAKVILGARPLLGADAPSRARKRIRTGDVLVSTVRPNLNAVAIVPPELDGQIASTGFCILRATERVLPSYLFHFVRSTAFVDALSRLVAGAMYPAVTDSQVLEQRLPLPSLGEQRRIVDLLSRAEGIVRLRREAQKKAAELVPAIFLEMFGDPATNPKGWAKVPLCSVAEIISGLTKGRALRPEESIDLPYLRVANVKDGYLDLAEVKTIPVRHGELERFLVRPGDLLMTEGGDPDKLGRAALWSGEIEHCVHQNHVFKVRCDVEQLSPIYLRSLVGSSHGKAYFMSVAKKTTGIASINKTQLSAFPVMIPPRTAQNDFERRVMAAESVLQQQNESLSIAADTRESLLNQIFSPHQ